MSQSERKARQAEIALMLRSEPGKKLLEMLEEDWNPPFPLVNPDDENQTYINMVQRDCYYYIKSLAERHQ